MIAAEAFCTEAFYKATHKYSETTYYKSGQPLLNNLVLGKYIKTYTKRTLQLYAQH